MKFFMNLALMVILAFALVACGSSGGDDGGDPRLGNHTATGTYTFNDQTGALTLNFTESDFQGCGPDVGVENFSVTEESSTQIRLDDDMIWTKTNGDSNTIVGTWELVDEDGTYLITFGANGSLTVTANITQCDSSGGEAVESSGCDIVANPDGPSFFNVANKLSSGLEWVFTDSFAFGADMKPGECTSFGLLAGSYKVDFTQCNIADEACTSTFGSTIQEIITVGDGQTQTITVNNGFF